VPDSNGKSITDSLKFDAAIRFNPPVKPLATDDLGMADDTGTGDDSEMFYETDTEMNE